MNSLGKINRDHVLSYYAQNSVLEHYEEATSQVGLWKSEKIIISKNIPDLSSRILELGCGCGRISFGLLKLGYSKVHASDFSAAMVKGAKKIASKMNFSIPLEVADATDLSYQNDGFDHVIFGFNGLMQIPGRENRIRAIREINRVLTSGGKFIFTSHDRSMPKWKKFWAMERKLWRKNQQGEKLLEFGDRYEETVRGMLYLHVPDIAEIKKDLKESGFLLEYDQMRSSIADESELIKKYSDDCRFWVARKI